MRIVIASTLLACACGPKAKVADAPGNTLEIKPLCIDPASPGGAPIAASEEDTEDQPWNPDNEYQLEDGWHVMANVDDDDGTVFAVVVTEGCYLGTCDPHLVRAVGDRITHREPLPFADTIPREGDYPFLVDWMVYRDLDGDGAPELWLGYNIVGAAEPAVGSTTRHYLSAWSPGDLAVRWVAEASSYAEASSLDSCDSTLVSVDADCDGDRDLVHTTSCQPQDCEERPDACPDGPTIARAVYDRAADGMYAKRP